MIRTRGKLIGGAALITAIAIAPLAGRDAGVRAQTAPPKQPGWNLPDDAHTVKNPRPVDDNVLAAGKAVYRDKCQRCHGPGGLGDGPDADPDYEEHMNLTDPDHAEENPDGIVFHKVMTGRSRPRMPAFKTELTEEQVWAVVAYVQSLRKKP